MLQCEQILSVQSCPDRSQFLQETKVKKMLFYEEFANSFLLLLASYQRGFGNQGNKQEVPNVFPV